MLSALWKWLFGGSLFLCIMLGIALKLERIHSHKLANRVTELTAQLDKIDRDARKARSDGKQISKDIRGKTDEQNRRIAGDADAVLVSGPGKAVCRPAPAAAGGHDQAGGKPDAPGPQVPPADSAAVPWPWLVQRAEQADLNRAEVLAWREWYDRLVASWPK
jgi:hypothetical protein